MIQPHEIPVGSIVTINNPKCHPTLKDVPMIVTGVSPAIDCDKKNTHSVSLEHLNQKPNTYYESYSQFIKYVEPIVLTDDLLLKCGLEPEINCNNYFEKKQKTGRLHKGIFFIAKRMQNMNDHTKSYAAWQYDEGNCKPEIKYLHQLQNLYFSLCNEQLQITL